MPRDMSFAQFRAACERYGFVRCGFLGYYLLPCGVETSVYNASPDNRRAWLAYLIAQEAKLSKKLANHLPTSAPQ
jgi:hypothetical protein